MIAVVERAYLLRAPWLTRLLPLIAEAFSTNSDFKAQTPTCAPSTGHGTPALLPRGTGVRDQHQHCLPALHCQVDGVPAKRSNTCDRARSNLRSEPWHQILWCHPAQCTARTPCQHKSHRHLTLALFASCFTKPTKATEKQTRGTKLLAVPYREPQNSH